MVQTSFRGSNPAISQIHRGVVHGYSPFLKWAKTMRLQVQPRHHISLHDLSASKVEALRTNLLQWFGSSARDLPWRVPPRPFAETPYKDYVHRLYICLLSETMLQQTQVKTVIAYYNKWLIAFPTLESLAEAEEEAVMACWAGLGYYSRAKRLRQAAQYLVTQFTHGCKEFPRDAEHWVKKVPGVGPYTAGAILSIAFGISSPIVDGNVQRVLSRILAIHGDTSTPKSSGSKLIWARAGDLVVGDQPGNLNQSLMELGATVCSPTKPDCAHCCVSEHCLAFAQRCSLVAHRKDIFQLPSTAVAADDKDVLLHDMEDLCLVCPSSIDPSILSGDAEQYIQSLYPFKPAKRAQKMETAIVMVIMREGQVHVEKKAKGLLAGLYDFPTILLDDIDASACESILANHRKQLNARLAGTTLHLFTHIRRTSHVLVCHEADAKRALRAFQEANDTGKWVDRDDLARIGVSELCLKNWRMAQDIKKMKGRSHPSEAKQAVKKRRRTSPSEESHSATPLRVADSSDAQAERSIDSLKVMVMPPEPAIKAIPSLKQSTIFTLFGRARKH